ncbi:MAG: histidine phosphatase family protein [Desulfovibrio sp.]|nr:histidine phosphatase family protein [Desulfovibrio sp.]
MKRIILVRHGALQREPHILVGQKDLSLSPLGRAQMQALAQSWPDSLWQEIVCVFTSDLSRCVESARILLRDHPELPLRSEPALREISLGQWEGLSKQAIERQWPGGHLMRGLDLAAFVPPNGESFRALKRRSLCCLERLRARYPKGTLCLVTHAGIIRVLLAAQRKLSLKQILRIPVEYASWTTLAI